MGDMRYVRVVARNKMSMVSRSVRPNRPSKLTERDIMLILLLVVYFVIITDRKCHDQVSDEDLDAKNKMPPSM